MNRKVCIIGGGPSGLTLGKEFNEVGIDYDLYESEADFGGVWNAAASSGRVYKSAHLISSKSITQLVDYPMPEEYPHYPNHELVLAYWRDVAKKFKVYEKTTFNTTVTKLEPIDDSWNVKLSTGETKDYDLVFVCNGLQRVPKYPGTDFKIFKGEVIHSKDYKSPEQVKNKRVLVMGAGNSGCDIVVDCVHHAREVFHSTRKGYHYQPKFIGGKPTADWMLSLGNKFSSKEEGVAYMKQVFKLAGFDGTDYGLPEPEHPLDAAHPILNSHLLYHIGHGDILPKGDVASFENKTVKFKDGSAIEADLIIFATGYDRQFSFLDSNYLEWKNGIPDLFLHAVPRHCNNLIFIGFINSATGFGSAIKSSVNFSKEYIKAYYAKSAGYEEFISRKKTDKPNVGRNHYIDSYRHQWEVDLWLYLKELNNYRAILSKN
jgi:Flavin-binding monooxygenase-like